MYPHRIRLRGPWTAEPLFRLTTDNERYTENLPAPFRMSMPGRWSDAGLMDFRGGVRFQRPFGYPGRIDDFERVWLTFGEIEGQAAVSLNEESLGIIQDGAGGAEFEVTKLLRQRNSLRVDVASSTPHGGLWGEVALEVRATAFLRDISFDRSGDQFSAKGLVVGESARPLDLYLFARGEFLSHQMIEPNVEGRSLSISGQLIGAPPSAAIHVRLELVDAATIWYVVRGVLEPQQSKSDPMSS